MRTRAYRNRRLAGRLDRAAEEWRREKAGRYFHLKSRWWEMVKTGLWIALFTVLFYLPLQISDDLRGLMVAAVPLVSLALVVLWYDVVETSMTQLPDCILPISNRRWRQQVAYQARPVWIYLVLILGIYMLTTVVKVGDAGLLIRMMGLALFFWTVGIFLHANGHGKIVTLCLYFLMVLGYLMISADPDGWLRKSLIVNLPWSGAIFGSGWKAWSLGCGHGGARVCRLGCGPEEKFPVGAAES